MDNDWETVIHSNERERNTTYKTIDIEKLGGKEITYK